MASPPPPLHWLLAWLRVDERSNLSRLCTLLSSDRLRVACEDAVLDAVCNLQARGCHAPALWYCVRFSFLSPAACARLEHSLTSVTALHPPPHLLPHIAAVMLARTRRAAGAHYAGVEASVGSLAGYVPPSSLTPSAGPTLDSPSVEVLLDAAGMPRHYYAFSVDVYGVSHKVATPGEDAAAGVGLYFIWVDPAQPMRHNVTTPRTVATPSRAPPEKAEPHPLPDRYMNNVRSWAALYGCTPRVFSGLECAMAVREASLHPDFQRGEEDVAAVPAGPGPLWDAYVRFAATPGGWIRCVDIARLAIAWLCGVGSVYVDTDMKAGTSRLPDAFIIPRTLTHMLVRDVPQAVCLPSTPLVLLAQDVDGIVQNNVVATTDSYHPFLTLYLRAVAASAAHEGHVIHATGPALCTAVLYAYRSTRAIPSPSRIAAARGLDVLPFPSDLAQDAQAVPFPDDHLAAIRTALPAALPDSAVSFLRTATARGIGTVVPAPAADDAGALRTLTSLAPPHGFTSLSSLHLSTCVHLCPPTTFFPRHWSEHTVPPAEAVGSPSSGGAMSLHLASTTHRPASFWSPATLTPSAASAAATRSIDSARSLSTHELRRATLLDTHDAVLRNVRSSAALVVSVARALDAPIRYGEHAWDCTWGDGYYSAAAVAGGETASPVRRAYAYGYSAAATSYGGYAAAATAGLPREEPTQVQDTLPRPIRAYLEAMGPNTVATWGAAPSPSAASADPFGSPSAVAAAGATSPSDMYNVAALAQRVVSRMLGFGW